MSDRLFHRRRVLRSGAAALLLPLAGTRAARAAQIAAVRVWPAADYTRVTLEHDNEIRFSHFLVENPDRLVVDVEGLDLNTTLRDLVSKITPDDPYIRAVRVGQNRPRVVRLVLDLKQRVRPQVFSVEPVAQFRHRLIFDLYPAEPVDPLMQLAQGGDAAPPADAPPARGGDAQHAGRAPDAQPPARATSSPLPEPPAGPAPLARAPETGPGSGDWITRIDPDSGRVTGAAPPANPADAARGHGAAVPPASAARPPVPADPRPSVSRLVTIALDPGHGGEDPGATGASGSYEKNVVLQIAQRLRRKLDGEANVRVFMTRDDDYFVPLNVRVQKARRVQADLFVSIHADAFINRDARGSSVFALSESGASSAAAKWIAQKENDADLIGGINVSARDRQLASVLLDLSTTAQINDSLKLGRAVLEHIGKINKLHRGEVEQASFAVLKAPDIPSILVETAFISNPDEERRLNDDAYQDKLADAIVSGIKRYFAKNPPLAKSRLAAVDEAVRRG
ncbi:N-acetylmuramoyl-L-alanine amidase [Derxia gummosa]|uniref:N-acetylmuramoyl-L-alanine amidase AmiC n=1 Tax=Derxia gummosa DSM 723 TaxID=1121388 RepID=A0A9U5G589_9BURK|nr:N-acetylmuramoyl-L-alanine amidase [Derxia gummosa]